MRLRTRACLDDVIRAGQLIQSALASMNLEDFLGDWEKQSAVERQFMIIGEALVRIRKDEPSVLDAIPESRDVIDFRNLLVHGYDSVNPRAIFKFAGIPLDQLIEIVTNLVADS